MELMELYVCEKVPELGLYGTL